MPSIEHLIPFFVATAIFAIMPGPAILYTAAQTMARGRRGGFLAVLGIHVGGLAHVIAAAAGLSAIFAHVPEAYLAIKILGALYLVWLGIGIIRGRTDAGVMPTVSSKNARRAFAESMVVEILNPKAALFFIAFLPQFVDPSAAWPIWLQFLILGWIVDLAFSLGDVVTVLLTSAVVGRLKRSATGQRIARWCGGSILAGLGAHLVASKS